MAPIISTSTARDLTSAIMCSWCLCTIGSRMAQASASRQKQSAQGGISGATHLAAI